MSIIEAQQATVIDSFYRVLTFCSICSKATQELSGACQPNSYTLYKCLKLWEWEGVKRVEPYTLSLKLHEFCHFCCDVKNSFLSQSYVIITRTLIFLL